MTIVRQANHISQPSRLDLDRQNAGAFWMAHSHVLKSQWEIVVAQVRAQVVVIQPVRDLSRDARYHS